MCKEITSTYFIALLSWLLRGNVRQREAQKNVHQYATTERTQDSVLLLAKANTARARAHLKRNWPGDACCAGVVPEQTCQGQKDQQQRQTAMADSTASEKRSTAAHAFAVLVGRMRA